MLRINVITVFPEFFATPLGLSIPSKAVAAGSVTYHVVNLRDFTHDRHRSVDDSPYGGGPGMVMKPAPFFEAVEALGARAPIVLMSARGKVFEQADAVRFAGGEELTLLCGHYKDVDQRVADHLATEELSIGKFVLSGGEPAALAVIDAVVRLLPGAMSDGDSFRGDSFWEGRGISAPSYTRPEEYRGFKVPDVLLSGHHAEIAKWRNSGTTKGGTTNSGTTNGGTTNGGTTNGGTTNGGTTNGGTTSGGTTSGGTTNGGNSNIDQADGG